MPYSLLFTYTPDGRVTKVSDYLTANETNYTYDALGNPTSYRGKPLTWERGRLLKSYGNTYFSYLSDEKRRMVNNVYLAEDSEGRVTLTSDGLSFLYDHTGLFAIDTQIPTNSIPYFTPGPRYYCRKDAQGNIISLLNSTGNCVVKYVYDAWGNHKVPDADAKG